MPHLKYFFSFFCISHLYCRTLLISRNNYHPKIESSMKKKKIYKTYDLQDEFRFFCQTLKVGKQSSAGKIHSQIESDSADSYVDDYLPALAKWFTKNTESIVEKEFLSVIPFLLSQHLFESCSQVLLRLHRIITINSYNSVTPSFKKWRAAFNKYCLFIQHEYIDKKNYCSSSKLYNTVSLCEEIDNCIVFYYITEGNIIRTNALKLSVNGSPKYNMRAIFDNRLKSQDRMSGDKTWLSLDLIAKIDPGIRAEYVDIINSETVLYYKDNIIIKNIKCKDIWCVSLERNVKNKYYMYVTIKEKTGYNTYQVYSPNAKEGKVKAPMEIEGIDKVVIDHVMPIDQSLRELASSGLIPILECCSTILKKAKKSLKSRDKKSRSNDMIVSEAFKDPYFRNINKQNLKIEMDTLMNDSWYRLMDSYQNGLKSNNLEFVEFRSNNIGKHIGIIMKVQDTKNNEYLVYRDLDTGVDYVENSTSLKSNYPNQKNLKELTSFGSKGWEVL